MYIDKKYYICYNIFKHTFVLPRVNKCERPFYFQPIGAVMALKPFHENPYQRFLRRYIEPLVFERFLGLPLFMIVTGIVPYYFAERAFRYDTFNDALAALIVCGFAFLYFSLVYSTTCQQRYTYHKALLREQAAKVENGTNPNAPFAKGHDVIQGEVISSRYLP